MSEPKQIDPLYWLVNAPKREKGEPPPFPLSVFWVVLIALAWLVRVVWRKVARS